MNSLVIEPENSSLLILKLAVESYCERIHIFIS